MISFLGRADTTEEETAEEAVAMVCNKVSEMPESTTDENVADCEAAEFEPSDSGMHLRKFIQVLTLKIWNKLKLINFRRILLYSLTI